jgi:hypothetical protein
MHDLRSTANHFSSGRVCADLDHGLRNRMTTRRELHAPGPILAPQSRSARAAARTSPARKPRSGALRAYHERSRKRSCIQGSRAATCARTPAVRGLAHAAAPEAPTTPNHRTPGLQLKPECARLRHVFERNARAHAMSGTRPAVVRSPQSQGRQGAKGSRAGARAAPQRTLGQSPPHP